MFQPAMLVYRSDPEILQQSRHVIVDGETTWFDSSVETLWGESFHLCVFQKTTFHIEGIISTFAGVQIIAMSCTNVGFIGLIKNLPGGY